MNIIKFGPIVQFQKKKKKKKFLHCSVRLVMTTIKVTEQRSLQHYDHGENKGGSSRRPKIETRPDSATLQPQAKSLTLSLKGECTCRFATVYHPHM